jgi:glycogen operon protein
MLRFVQALVAFRRRQPNVRRGKFLTGKVSPNPVTRHPTPDTFLPDVSWYNPAGRQIEWHNNGPSFTSVFGTSGLTDPAARAIMIMLHAGNQPHRFVVPSAAANLNWRLFINTAAPAPADIYPDADGPAPGGEPMVLENHSLRCYVAE